MGSLPIVGAYRGVDGQTYYRHDDGKVCSKAGDHWHSVSEKNSLMMTHCERSHDG